MREGWTYKKLGEVCEIFGRIGFRGYTREDYVNTIEEGAISLSPSNIINNQLDFSNCTYITWDKYNQSPEIKIVEGDVLFVKTASVGKCAYVSALPHESTINPQFVVFKNISIYNRFLFYQLLSSSFQYKVKRITSGTSVPTITQKDLSELGICYPNIEEQQRIVSELDLLSSIIEKKKAQLKEYDQLAQSIFYDMFGDPVTNEKGWEVKRLEDVCEATSSKRIFADEYTTSGIPFYRGKEITEKGKDLPLSIELYISEERYNELKKIGIPQIGDILITAVGTIGNIWVVNDNTPFYFKDGNIIWLRNIRMQNSVYFKFILEKLIEIYKQEMVRGAAYNALTIVNLKGMPVPLPPLPLQQSFASKIEAIEHQKALIQQSITETESLFNSRMDYYFD